VTLRERELATEPARSVNFYFDPMCPFAYQASLWIRDVREQTGLVVNWRFFSLEEVNRVDGKKHPWEREWSYGWSLMRIGALLRRRDMDELDAWYGAIGAALHRDGRKPHDPQVARQILTEIGLETSVLDEAISDPTTHDDVKTDHDRVSRAGAFGVPTLVFEDGQMLFGPVLKDPPASERAIKLWELTTAWLEFPHLYELQRPKSRTDVLEIAEALQPYLAGRDWESIDRGRKIVIPDPNRRTTQTEKT